MTEYLIDANDEFKRVDHLIFVSLKYTRTVDVLRSVIERMINGCSFLINGYINLKNEEREIEDIPEAPGAKAELMKHYYGNNREIIEYVDFYLFLRRLIRAKFTRSTEFRRHVTMTSIMIDPESESEYIVKVDIDLVQEYFIKVKGFLADYKNRVLPEESDLYD